MDYEEKVDFLGGQIHGLLGVCVALINAQSEIGLMRTQDLLEAAEQGTLARVEAETGSDNHVEGVRDVIDRLKETGERALERRTRPPPSAP
jgi:hypothetical protein